MAKFWQPGLVKTRLGATLGMSSSAELQRVFLQHLCSTLATTAQSRELVVAPDDRIERFRSELVSWGLDSHWSFSAQGEGNLGTRMRRWFHRRLDQQAHSVAMLIGADCPTLSSDDVQVAADALNSHDVVLGPAADGGYYLIGLAGPWEDRYENLFHDLPWSSAELLAITCQRISACGLSLALLDVREDVDTITELLSLRVQLAHETGCAVELLKKINAIVEADQAEGHA